MTETAASQQQAARQSPLCCAATSAAAYPRTCAAWRVPLAEAPTVQAALARAGVPAGAVGLLLVNRQTVSMDAALHAGDTLEVLPLLGGG